MLAMGQPASALFRYFGSAKKHTNTVFSGRITKNFCYIKKNGIDHLCLINKIKNKNNNYFLGLGRTHYQCFLKIKGKLNYYYFSLVW